MQTYLLQIAEWPQNVKLDSNTVTALGTSVILLVVSNKK